MTTNANLAENLVRRLADISAYLQLARRPGIGNTARSAYLRAAIMTQTTVVEGLVFYVIRRHAQDLNPPIGKFTKARIIQRIKDSTISVSELQLVSQESKDILLEGRESTFILMNSHCLAKGIVTNREWKCLESARKKRASFHIFTVSGSDRGYTTAVSRQMDKAIDIMIAKLALYPIF